MESWLKISLLLCVFGFLKEIRPSGPFIYDYLIDHRWRNLTVDQVSKEVYPVGTYSNLVLLILVFLITDMCRYKALIIVLGLSAMTIWAMLIWTTSLLALQILEVFYGMFSAAEVAYYTYIYAKVDKVHYQKVTSHTRAAILAGKAISGITSQTLVSTNALDFKQLNYITFAAVSAATLWALFLPPVAQSLYFHSESTKNQPISTKIASAFKLMKSHFLTAFTNLYVVKWSIWWALSTCGYVQVEDYMQPLYASIQTETAYNGGVEATLTLLGFLGALIAGYMKINWEIKGELTLGLFSLVQGVLVGVASQTTSIYLCYACYIIFGILYFFMVTIASSEIAKRIDKDSYGLIFGINTFVALVFNSILTAIFATKGIGFAFGARNQFIAYGSYHLLIAVVFLFMGIRTVILKRQAAKRDDIVQT